MDESIRLTRLDRWVKTENGQNFADAVGAKEPPMTIEQSVNGVLAQVCTPSRTSEAQLIRSYARLTLLRNRLHRPARS
jgi:hypothetical protein